MARPREFDTEKVLHQVIEVFRINGFEKTSFSQLEKATGLKKGSLFAAFGDKKKLFAQALKQYHTERCKTLTPLCSNNSARESLTQWILSASGIDSEDRKGRGCLTLNSLVETAPHNRECARIVEIQLQAMEDMLKQIVREGIKKAEFRRALDPACAAKYLICVVSGLQALSRTPHTCAISKNRKQFVDLVLGALS